MTNSMKEELQKLGWYLSNDGIEICKEEIGEIFGKVYSTKDIINCALNIDLAEIGENVLPDDLVKGKVKEFGGPCVLQIVKIRNASAPKANEDSSVAPRLLKLHLTDGHKTCVGIEHESFDKKFSLGTPPGTKVRLDGMIKLQNGLLLLNSRNISCLDGVVESLYNKWKSTKEASGFARDASTGEDAPPPFVAFGKKVTYQCNTSKRVLQSATKTGDEAGDDSGFSEQRESAIARVKKSMGDSQGKNFSGGRSKLSASGSNSHVQKNEKEDHNRHQQSRNEFQRKSDHFEVDENLRGKIIQMGFSRYDANSALRKHDNNLERALDELIHPSNDPGSQRNARGGRSGNVRGRGRRGNNRAERYNRNEPESQNQSASTTLFDYVESSMTKSQGKSETKAKKTSSASQVASSGGVNDEDDALQEEYILQYVKELSLVETRGGVDETKLERRTETPSDSTRSENSGVSKYRSGGNQGTSANSRRRDEAYSDTQNFHSNQNRSDRYGSDNRNRSRGPDQNHDDATGHERPPRREHFNSKTFLRSDSRHKRDHYSRDDRNEQPRLHNDVREGNRTDRNDNYNDRTSHNNKRHHDNAYSNARDYTDDSDDSRPGHHQFGGGRRNDRNDIDRRKVTGQYYPDRSQKFIPPRLQKKHQQEQNAEIRRTNNNQPRNFQSKKGLTLGDTARQMKSRDRSPPAQPPPTIYPVYSNTAPTSRQRTSASHSYQDQRQQQMNRSGGESTSSDQRSDQYRINDDPTQRDVIEWKPGMVCQARYWEDEQYYKAVVTDVHTSEPTAVVVFIGYGNSEEVYFDDMRPDKSAMGQVKRSDAGGESFSNTGKYSNDRRGPLRPSRSLYQPPIRK